MIVFLRNNNIECKQGKMNFFSKNFRQYHNIITLCLFKTLTIINQYYIHNYTCLFFRIIRYFLNTIYSSAVSLINKYLCKNNYFCVKTKVNFTQSRIIR